jgi:hypothetical protein
VCGVLVEQDAFSEGVDPGQRRVLVLVNDKNKFHFPLFIYDK